MGRAVARLLRGQALQRFPGELGDQPRRVPLRDRQGRRQGHHVPRCAARHRRACAAWRPSASSDDPITPAELDEAARTQGVTIGARRHRAGPNRLVGTVSGDRRRRRAGRGPGLDVRVVAARPRGRRGRGRQPDGREPGVRCRRRVPADAHAVPARHGPDARRVLGPHGAGRRLRRRRRVRIPAHRTAAEGDRRGRLTRQSRSRSSR